MLCLIIKLHKHSTIYFSILSDQKWPTGCGHGSDSGTVVSEATVMTKLTGVGP